MHLIAKPHNTASTLALEVYSKVLDEVRGDRLVNKAVQRVGDALFIQGQHIDLNHFDRVWIAGSGKASISMAKATVEILCDRVAGGLIITKAGSLEPIAGLNVVESAHPVPDQSSLDAGARMLDFAGRLNEKDLIIYLLSGGSSALMESLSSGLSLQDLQLTTKALLESGSDIRVINSIRTRLSQIKGGGLADAFFPATVVNLVLSDVIGNDLSAIGSGPFISRTKLAGGLAETPLDLFPSRVQKALLLNSDSPNLHHPVQHFVIGSISLAIHAAAEACKGLGLLPLPYGDPMHGDARDMARKILTHGGKYPREESCMIFGGETTVAVQGNGLGGRCQEMAISVVRPISKFKDVCFLASSTDGTDGPTEAAGGFVDPGAYERANNAGLKVWDYMRRNDSYHYLKACDGLIYTGPTGSNVTDIALFVRAS